MVSGWLFAGILLPILLPLILQTPQVIPYVLIAVNIALKLLLIGRFGVVGLALATAVGSWINLILLVILARRRRWTAPSPALARACAEAGIAFVGPPVHALEVMGDKIGAKAHVARSGVPVVPGTAEPGLSDDALVARAADVGYPLLVKPSAGGGGSASAFPNSRCGMCFSVRFTSMAEPEWFSCPRQ